MCVNKVSYVVCDDIVYHRLAVGCAFHESYFTHSCILLGLPSCLVIIIEFQFLHVLTDYVLTQ